MDTANSQKRSPRSSAKSKRSTVDTGVEQQRASFAASNAEEFEDRYDHSNDMVERVRQARAAAERKMNAFTGDLGDYVLVRTIMGQKSSSTSQAQVETDGERQARLEFSEAETREHGQ